MKGITILAVRWGELNPDVKAAILHQQLKVCNDHRMIMSAERLLRIMNLGNPRVILHDNGVIMRYQGIAPDDREAMRLLFTTSLA